MFVSIAVSDLDAHMTTRMGFNIMKQLRLHCLKFPSTFPSIEEGWIVGTRSSSVAILGCRHWLCQDYPVQFQSNSNLSRIHSSCDRRVLVSPSTMHDIGRSDCVFVAQWATP